MKNGTVIFCDGMDACNIQSYKFRNCNDCVLLLFEKVDPCEDLPWDF